VNYYYLKSFIKSFLSINIADMDLIDEILADWATQRPDINCGGKA
jgi:hypothetical protein